ncbi:hypothetical protein J6590_023074 [Homalodisca vitripennis]|nr:hypothetical protein J6590_023074 [Homalodisca vitripennis]
MTGQTGCLQGQIRSATTHSSSSHARRCLIWLSCDNRCTRYTTPLATMLDRQTTKGFEVNVDLATLFLLIFAGQVRLTQQLVLTDLMDGLQFRDHNRDLF